MRRAPQLLQLLLTLLATNGLAPEALTPWRSWVLFKQFVRTVDELPDPCVSVQISAPSLEIVRVPRPPRWHIAKTTGSCRWRAG
jgi:hypothetical protein